MPVSIVCHCVICELFHFLSTVKLIRLRKYFVIAEVYNGFSHYLQANSRIAYSDKLL
jgi:hypothetical protein